MPTTSHLSPSPTTSRRILLAVSGMSPQIITETLYALLHAEPAWVPDEIHLLTTVTGKNKAVMQLLSPQKDGNPGYFHRLLKEYRVKQAIRFDDSTIHVIHNSKGQALEDLRTPADNEAAADCISNKIRELTADPHTELHVSLAGGRKTMGFYAGYALSLYGRQQDRLSHVLVSSEYESLSDFFYPTRKTLKIQDRNGAELDASKAKIWQAEIPFVRMRCGLPESLLTGKHSFSETIDLARKSTEGSSLLIQPRHGTVTFNKVEIKLSSVHMLLLTWAAWRRARNKGPIRTLVEGEHNYDDAQELMEMAEKLWLEINSKSRKGLERDGVTKYFLETNISRLNGSLKQKFGTELASRCRISIVKQGKISGYTLPADLDITIR